MLHLKRCMHLLIRCWIDSGELKLVSDYLGVGRAISCTWVVVDTWVGINVDE